jgi:hypothetical protein
MDVRQYSTTIALFLIAPSLNAITSKIENISETQQPKQRKITVYAE